MSRNYEKMTLESARQLIKDQQEQLKQKNKEIESLKSLEDHLNKRDKINREKIEKLEQVVEIAEASLRIGEKNSLLAKALNRLDDKKYQRVKESDNE